MKNKLIFWAVYIAVVVFFAKSYPFPDKGQPKIGPTTVTLIKEFEGVRYTAYQDSKGYWTIGVGHLIKSDTRHLKYAQLSYKDVRNILENDLAPCQDVVLDHVPVKLNQSQFDALISLCHNIGYDNFARSDVIKYLKKGNYVAAANSFLNWNKPQELTKRRQKERQLFISGA